LIAHDAPLAPGRKARPAQAAKAGVFEGADDLVFGEVATDEALGQGVAALGLVSRVIDDRALTPALSQRERE
jgi:hypothetical protein